jgi:hypothetical protein
MYKVFLEGAGVLNFARFLQGIPFFLLSVLVPFLFSFPASAQPAGTNTVPVTQNFTSSTAASTRIDPADAPIIDADLSDPAWARATLITDFKQAEPATGAPPTERTELRIMYDENSIYVGVYSYDSDPSGIILRSMQRDGPLYTGDLVEIRLDPGLTRRNAYSFQIGPSGGRGDRLLLNNTQDLEEWDPIWVGRAQVVEDGWIAEMEIPIQSISYEEGQTDWGFDFRRTIRRKNEEVYWSSINPNLESMNVSQAGTLTGLSGFDQGVGLDVQVYGVSRIKRDWQMPGEDTAISFSGGGNAFYRITPALTGTLTYNPDFSDAPLDARQVNTTRFSLFFPETRDFFLQDAGAFEFGGRGFTRSARGGGERAANNAQPFFSRNIGLVGGQAVSIVGGGKVSGEFSGYGVGLLSVMTDKTPSAGNQLLSVARISRPIFNESQIGFIVTNGDPTGLSSNTVAGGDFQYRNSNFLGSEVLTADAYFERSFSGLNGNDESFGISLNSPNQPWGWDAAFKQVGANYDPALGFVNRSGIRLYEANVNHLTRYQPGASILRQIQFSLNNFIVTGLDNQIQSREHSAVALIATQADHRLELGATNFFENLPAEFDLPDDLTVPGGEYNWTNFYARVQSSRNYPLSVVAEVACCNFYNGDSLETSLQANYRPNRYYEISARHGWTRLKMPNGAVDVHIASLNASVAFTPNMHLAVQTQYDNISQSVGFLARYRWEFIPGDELLIAFGQAAVLPGTGFQAQGSQLTIRIGHTLRF